MKKEKMELEVTALKDEMNLFVQTSPEGYCNESDCHKDCLIEGSTCDSHYAERF